MEPIMTPAPASAAPAALRGHIVTFRGNPFLMPPHDALVDEPDGLVIITDGRITHAGAYGETIRHLPAGVPVADYRGCLISAGFVDTHVHYPQLPMIAAYGEQLLEWLERYTFPTERRFADETYATTIARQFLHGLLRCGTTTAAVYCTVHPQSVDAFFGQSTRLGTLMVAGKVLMDRNAPDYLRDTAQRGYDESRRLIDRWHGRNRQHYAVTPRFAPTSTPEQLELAGALLKGDDTLFMQTHLAENRAEVAWVADLYPDSRSYLDVYDRAGLVRPRSVMGHGIYVDEHDLCRCHESGCALAHCPTSNLFLGSGAFRLFDVMDAKRPVRTGLGTDVGAGTSLSHLQSMNEAYKIAQMTGKRLHPVQAFWLATRGGAEALHLDDRIGAIAPGMDADLCILDPRATPLQALRAQMCDSTADILFTLMMLGDDRSIRATWVGGRLVHDRDMPAI
ncbi:guanine deaminase [Komagataeibacter europaeus LMG 18890]|nr:guanine deaminase [Komagataeibacter europaeus LMG 18890]